MHRLCNMSYPCTLKTPLWDNDWSWRFMIDRDVSRLIIFSPYSKLVNLAFQFCWFLDQHWSQILKWAVQTKAALASVNDQSWSFMTHRWCSMRCSEMVWDALRTFKFKIEKHSDIPGKRWAALTKAVLSHFNVINHDQSWHMADAIWDVMMWFEIQWDGVSYKKLAIFPLYIDENWKWSYPNVARNFYISKCGKN